MSFLQLVLSLDRRKRELILFWIICHLDIFTDARLTDITTFSKSISKFQWLTNDFKNDPLLQTPRLNVRCKKIHENNIQRCNKYLHLFLSLGLVEKSSEPRLIGRLKRTSLGVPSLIVFLSIGCSPLIAEKLYCRNYYLFAEHSIQ